MRQGVLLSLFFLFQSLITLSQTITIKEQGSKEPLEWVTLSSQSPRAFTTTNAKGQADLTAFHGASAIEIRKLGHKPQTLSFDQLNEKNYLLYLEPSNLNLDEVVVSATRWRQSSADVPTRITSISRKQVSLQNPQTAADLLNVSGKVFIQKSQQGGGSPMIRGFATNRLLYAVDGVRMNTAIFRGGNIQNVISMDPFAIENTEIVFGPGSVMYGSDAIGGVMSFQTLVPELSLNDKPLFVGKARSRYSSANNEKTAHFDMNVGWKKWALVTSMSSFNYGDLRQGSHGPHDYLKPFFVQRIDSVDQVIDQNDPLLQKPSGYSQINLMQKVRFHPNENWDFQYGYHYSETSPYGRYDRHNRMQDGLPRYAEWRYGPQIWQMHHVNLTNRHTNLLYDQLTMRLAAQYFEESRIDRSFNESERTTNTEKVNAYSINLDLVKSLTNHTINYGVEYVVNNVNSDGQIKNIDNGILEDGPARYPEAQWQSIGLFINDQYRISEQWLINGGLRYNHSLLEASFDTNFYPFPFNSARVNNGALTGSLGAVFRPGETWVVSSNFATAFRSPNVDDIGKVFDSEPGAVTVPNPALKAEYAYSFDLGLAKVFAEQVKLDLSVYYTILNNAMVRRNFTLNGNDSIVYQGVMSQVQALQNAAEAHVYGLQAGVEIKLGNGFDLSSDFNYQQGREESNDGSTSPSRHAAPVFGVSRLTYQYEQMMLQTYVSYQAQRSHENLSIDERRKTEIYALDEKGDTYAPDWYTWNLKGMYMLSEYLSVSAGVENLTDQRYRPYSSGLSGAGRNFVISVDARF